MTSSIRISTAFTLILGLLGWPSFLPASQPFISTTGESSLNNSFEVTEYSYDTFESSITLKWPRGSLIFPENNDPSKTNEVFLLSEAFTSQSELQSLHFHFGLQFFSRRKYREAKSEYLKALKLKPNAPVIYNNLGLIYFNSKKYRNAEKAYRKALQLDPGYTSALAKLALTLAAQKKYISAERKFKQAIRAEPSNPEHHLNLGHFYYYMKKDYREAKNSYQKALKLNSRSAKAKINLRDINRKFRKWKDQESDFENSWGNDFDYDTSNNAGNSPNTPSYPEEADIAGTWEEGTTQNPLF